jgi:hypothetical protein
MADHINLRRRGNSASVALPKIAQQVSNRLLARAGLGAFLALDAADVLQGELGVAALPFDLSLPQTCRRIIRQRIADLVEAGLLAAGKSRGAGES